MRLSESEQQSIIEIFKKFSGTNAKIYLFGSRADDSKKGGDIDLLIVVATIADKLSFNRLDFIVELVKKIGERKVDVTLATEDELANDVFLMSIMDSAVEFVV